MIATTVHIHVKPEHLTEFIEATRRNHEASIREPGNLRFDVLQHSDDPTKFTLYEVYETEEAVAAHKETTHYFTWRDTVTDWMVSPRYGVRHQVIAPTDVSLW